MNEEFQKRPFLRPLFVWILGICLQMLLPGYWVGVFLLVLAGVCLLIAILIHKSQNTTFIYEMRWTWGMFFSVFLLSLASWVTLVADQRREPRMISHFPQFEYYQRRLVDRIDCLKISDEEKAVLASLSIGYRKDMTREMRRHFSIAGVAHILAVSGFHVAVVCGFVSFLLQGLPRNRIGRSIHYLLSMLLLWSYVGVTGISSPATRAGVMLSLYLTGRWIRRDTDGYNIWAASAFCMLVYDPFYLFDVGFQLSYLAVLSILYLQPRLKSLILVRNPLLAIPWEWITVSLAAQIGTAFLCLYYFNSFSLVFLFTNIPLTCISLFLIPTSLLWLVVPEWLPGLSYLQYAVEYLSHAMVCVVELFSSIPGVSYSGHFGYGSLLVGYAMLFCFLMYSSTHRPYQLLVALFLLLILLLLQLFPYCNSF